MVGVRCQEGSNTQVLTGCRAGRASLILGGGGAGAPGPYLPQPDLAPTVPGSAPVPGAPRTLPRSFLPVLVGEGVGAAADPSSGRLSPTVRRLPCATPSPC